MRRRAFVPTALGPLEGRIAPSHAGPAHLVARMSLSGPTRPLTLTGTIEGTDTTVRGRLILSGSGTVSPQGRVDAFGFLVIRSGVPALFQASVSLAGPGGIVTLGFHEVRGGAAGGTRLLSYQVVHGTGAYRVATGHGTAVFQQGGPIQALDPTGHAITGLRGTFSLTFGNATPPLLPLGGATT